jgi:hypothetical protein
MAEVPRIAPRSIVDYDPAFEPLLDSEEAAVGASRCRAREALSEYNSGSSIVGFDNGYVANVVDGEFYVQQLR